MSRRAVLARLLPRAALASVLALACAVASAGNQKEEALADAVKVALSNAIRDGAPPRPVFKEETARQRYARWFEQMSARLTRKVPDAVSRRELLETIWYESSRAGLDPGLVMGLIQVESAYRKYAISIAGARGYMQVMPFWTKVVGDGSRSKLFHMQSNLRYGCSILRMYLDMEKGSLYMALGRYNGSRGRPGYPNAVLAAWKNWEFK